MGFINNNLLFLKGQIMSILTIDTLIFNPDSVRNMRFDKKPTRCPICNNGIDAIIITAAQREDDTKMCVEVVYRCPIETCSHLFIANYVLTQRSSGIYYKYFGPATRPSIDKKTFEDAIQNISSEFCDIYNQALEAETMGLNKISGSGYRKALEFLVKDFAILRTKNDIEKEQIKKSLLGVVINTYIDHEKIKKNAKRASWLGNDETHYTRIWSDKDIDDLKINIDLVVHYIYMDEISRLYEEEMQ